MVFSSLSFQCANYRLHTGNTQCRCFLFLQGLLAFPPAQVAIVVCLFVFGPRLRFLLFCCWFMSRCALLAWGSAFRLRRRYAVGYLFSTCRLALYRLGHLFTSFFMFSIQDRAFELNRACKLVNTQSSN